MTTQERINAAMLLSTDKQYAAALALLEPTSAEEPDNFPVAGLLGTALANLGRYDEAKRIWGQLLVASPMNPLTWLNLGTTYQEEFKLAESDYCFYRSLELKPPFSNMLMYGLGSNRLRAGKYAEALPFYEALPDDPRAVNSCGVLRMKMGDWKRGAIETEARLKFVDNFWPTDSIPRWDGERIYAPGSTVLLVNDQGIGDCIFYTRIARDFMQYHPTKLYIAHEGLAELIRYLHPDLHVDSGSQPPTADIQMALGSLPAYYATTGWSNCPIPFIQPAIDLTGNETWLTFRGSRENTIDGCRSLKIEHAVWLANVLEDVAIAQADLTPEEARQWFYGRHETIGFTGSWVETAELMRTRCKLLITVDTAMAHLATALDIPAIVLVSFAADWRWDHQPGLFPNARLVHQKTPGRWDDVFDEVVAAAQEMNPVDVLLV
jgi:hypothetical protein